MRLIPGKTKVKIEVFKHVTIADIIVGLVGLVAVTLCVISSLPGRWIIGGIVAAVFALLLFRLDDEPLYVFLWNMLKYFAYPRRIVRVYDDKAIKNLSKGDRQALLDDFFGNEESTGKSPATSDEIEEFNDVLSDLSESGEAEDYSYDQDAYNEDSYSSYEEASNETENTYEDTSADRDDSQEDEEPDSYIEALAREEEDKKA